MELISHNITANRKFYPSVIPQSFVLDWDEDKLPVEIEGRIDVVMCFLLYLFSDRAILSDHFCLPSRMADVTYNVASFPSLIATLRRLCNAASTPPVFLLAYKERDPAERILWDMAHEIGIGFVEVERIKGAGATPIEIHLGYCLSPRGDP